MTLPWKGEEFAGSRMRVKDYCSTGGEEDYKTERIQDCNTKTLQDYKITRLKDCVTTRGLTHMTLPCLLRSLGCFAINTILNEQ